MLLALLLGACAPINPAEVTTPDPYHGDPPLLAGLSLECDPTGPRFLLSVRSTNWTGGGELWMARGRGDVERHPFGSDKASREGAWDCLSLSLSTAVDPASASPGSSSRYGCEDMERLSFLLSLRAPDGSANADCRAWGADPDLFSAIEGAPACSAPLDTGETPPEVAAQCD
jgi:hypothetical protein